MKHYKRTIKKLKKNSDYAESFLMRLAKKLNINNGKPAFQLRLIHIKRRFYDSGLMELLAMQILVDKVRRQELEGLEEERAKNVVELDKFRRK